MREIAVPNIGSLLRQGNALGLNGRIGRIEKAELHFGRMLGEEGKVYAAAIVRGSEWKGASRPDGGGSHDESDEANE
jgi:hypothetical protein